jgi:hypothetical protein
MGSSPRPRPIPVVAAALLLAAIAVPADAAKKASSPKRDSEEVYRCRDAQGQFHFGQSIPAPCMDLDIEVLDQTGRVVRIIPGRLALEQGSAKKAAEQAAQDSAQRDRTLLATYLSVPDIERLRDQRLEQLVQQTHVTRQYIDNLREREARLMADVQRYRPYSDKPKAPPLPDHVAEEIVNTVNGLQVYEQQLAKSTVEQDRLRADFAADIARFKELKGIR